MKTNNQVLNAKEAADFLGAHVETIRRLARRGDIPGYKIGKDWRFRRDALLDWAKTHYLRSKPPCVLVIDDDQGVRKLIARFLKPGGYQVLPASNGAEGLRHLESKAVDLILLDLKMPEMSGPEFLQHSMEAGHRPPVIVVTGYPDSDLMAEAMRYGPITLVAKPIEMEQLMHAVRTAFNGALKAEQGTRAPPGR